MNISKQWIKTAVSECIKCISCTLKSQEVCSRYNTFKQQTQAGVLINHKPLAPKQELRKLFDQLHYKNGMGVR